MSLRTRLLLAFAYALLVVIVALEVPLALNVQRRVDAEVRSEAESQAQLVAASAASRLSSRADLAVLARRSAKDLGGRVIVVDRAGRLLVDSAGGGLRATSYASRPEVAAALRGRAEQGERHSASLDEDLLFTAVPVIRAGRRDGAVRVTQSVDGVRSEVHRSWLALAGVGLVALLLGLGVAWLLAGSIARPLRALAASARRVAGGDLDERAEPTGTTEQREMAEAFNDMTVRLGAVLQSQREFVANASHQLRTPLTGLGLRLEAAAAKTDDPAVARDLAAAEAETARLARLLSELLTLAREQERPPGEPLSLDDAAAAAHARWEGPAQRAEHPLTLAGAEGATVESRRDDLALILDNLVENALNYAPAGTPVRIEWGADDRGAWLAVADAGPGVPADERERVFERFYRGAAGRDAPGTGLGLPLVRALAERWGGTAEIDPAHAPGTRVEVRLPAASLPSPDPDLTRV